MGRTGWAMMGSHENSREHAWDNVSTGIRKMNFSTLQKSGWL
jgi:hypothetical protein